MAMRWPLPKANASTNKYKYCFLIHGMMSNIHLVCRMMDVTRVTDIFPNPHAYLPTLRLLDLVSVFFISPKSPSAETEISASWASTTISYFPVIPLCGLQMIAMRMIAMIMIAMIMIAMIMIAMRMIAMRMKPRRGNTRKKKSNQVHFNPEWIKMPYDHYRTP